MVQDKNERILDFDETKDEDNLIIDESSPKPRSLNPHIEETMEVQLYDQIDEALEIQIQVQQLKAMEVLPMEEKNLLSYSIIPLPNEPQQSKHEHEEIAHCESDIDECIYVFNKFMSIEVDGQEFQILMIPNLFGSTYVFKKSLIFNTTVLLRSKWRIYLVWLMIFDNDASGHKDLRTNHFGEGEFITKQEPKSTFSIN